MPPKDASIEQEIHELLQRPMRQETERQAWKLLQVFRARMLQTVRMQDGEVQRDELRRTLRDALIRLLREE